MRRMIALSLAIILLTGCTSEPEPIHYDYLPELYDTLNLTDYKDDDPKLGVLIKQVCATKQVEAPKDYFVGKRYFVNLVSQFPESTGIQAVYTKTKQNSFLYCHDSVSKPGFHKLNSKQDQFPVDKLVVAEKEIHFEPLSADFKQIVRTFDHSLMASARQLTLPTTGYLVARATNEQTHQTVVTNVMELTPLVGMAPLFLQSNIQIQEPYEVQLNLMGQQRYQAAIHSSKEQSTIAFKEQSHVDGTYGLVTVTEKSGKTNRYKLTVKQEQQMPTGLELPPDEFSDDEFVLPRYAVFHDRPFDKLKYNYKKGQIQDNAISEQEFLKASPDETKQLVRLIQDSEVIENKGRPANRTYLTILNGEKAQQFKIYLDQRINKTDVYLEDVHRKISFKLSAEGRDLLLDTYQIK